MEKQLHIIAFDVPYPPNYGGIVDVFYKLKTLHELGVKIIYHCFYYKGHNPPNNELKKYCSKIYFYQRKKSIDKLLLSKYPYIVASRSNKALLDNLLEDDNPILFDGIQTVFYLNHEKLKDRFKIYRAHNIEHDYYYGLSKWEKNKLKKTYLNWEAKKLHKIESILSNTQAILSISKMDIGHFVKYAPTYHVPPFFNNEMKGEWSNQEEKIILFNGNLSVIENEEAVLYIIEKIAPIVNFEFHFAGKDPSKNLIQKSKGINNVKIIPNPSQEEMERLIKKAKVNLLITFQQTGIKLKLLHTLHAGKHIIINSFMDDSGIFSDLCHVANEPESIKELIIELMDMPFTQKMFEERLTKFNVIFDNKKNGEKIVEILAARY